MLKFNKISKKSLKVNGLVPLNSFRVKKKKLKQIEKPSCSQLKMTIKLLKQSKNNIKLKLKV